MIFAGTGKIGPDGQRELFYYTDPMGKKHGLKLRMIMSWNGERFVATEAFR